MTTTKPIVLITGANQGLGYYTAQQLAATGSYHILIGSRDIQKAHKAIASLVEDTTVPVSSSDFSALHIDVDSDDSIKAAAQEVEKIHGKLDILINNAGVAQAQAAAKGGSGPSIRDIYRSHYETNLFGAAATTEAFLPLLRKSSTKRLAFTSSTLGSLALASDSQGPMAAANWPIYRSTKTALNMIMLYYAQSLEKDGFVVSGADPGYCGTNLNGFQGFKDPRDGAKEIVKAAIGSREEVHGKVVGDQGVVPW